MNVAKRITARDNTNRKKGGEWGESNQNVSDTRMKL